MKLQTTLPALGSALHLAPILAMVLILTIYAYLSSSLATPSGVSVRLPESASSLGGFERAHIITLALGDPEPLYFDGKALTLAELPEVLARQPQSEHRAILYADRAVAYGRVTEVSDIILKAGFQLAYATTPSQQPKP
jgi:biopolymer transport protein ExbD